MGVVLDSSTKLSLVDDIQFCHRFSVLCETERKRRNKDRQPVNNTFTVIVSSYSTFHCRFF